MSMVHDSFLDIEEDLRLFPKVWLVTGVAGFIGSNLLQYLLSIGQTVVGLDNFSTGYQHNLDEVRAELGEESWQNFKFFEGDICNLEMCIGALKGVDYVLHQAALGSVPRSIEDPIKTSANNISGFLNMLVAARDEGVKSFTYAASSSTYGDHPGLPKVEDEIGRPLSPYAVTKFVNELYADVFFRTYGFNTIGLRYFNVFGRRQDPNGAYAAVIPKWIASLIKGEDVFINGDGETSRDFCYIENTVKMNVLAATAKRESQNEIYNVAVGQRTTLNNLFECIKSNLLRLGVNVADANVSYREFRSGDVRHSLADVSKAEAKLGYLAEFSLADGVEKAMPWYIKFLDVKK